MSRTTTIDRIQRLDLLTARLKSGDELTVGGLAREFRISLRTLSRDIALLRDQGVTIDADRGRGGGLRLSQRWGVGRLTLTYVEAVDLLVGLAAAEQMSSPLLMGNLGTVRRKLVASFSPAMAERVGGLKARIRVGGPVEPRLLAGAVRPDTQVAAQLHQAFLDMHALSILYIDVDGNRTRRSIQPHYLLLCSPIWYVLAEDALRQEARTFRCDRIISADPLADDRFKLLPISHFDTALKGITTI
jgi:predicted DNA-binding transcriptional regulator YafY